MPFGVPISKFTRQHFREKFARHRRLLQEFKALMKVVPVNEAQYNWIARTLDDFECKHPELQRHIERIREEFNPIKDLPQLEEES